ncbi:MAG: hypothetical protein ACTSQQ_14475, partial [Candidatus Helarchaeota archaeon]
MHNKIRALIQKGVQAQQQGNFQAALAFFREALQLAQDLKDSQLITQITSLIHYAETQINLQELRKETAKQAESRISHISGIGQDESILQKIIDKTSAAQQTADEILNQISAAGGLKEDTGYESDEEEVLSEPPIGHPPTLPAQPSAGSPAPPPKTQPSAGGPASPPAAPRLKAKKPKADMPGTSSPLFPTSPVGDGVPPSPQPVRRPPMGPPASPPPSEDRPTKREAKKRWRKAKVKGKEKKEVVSDEQAPPKKIKRYGDVTSPMEMTEKKEYLVNVGLRMFKEDVKGVSVPMQITVPVSGPPILEIFVIGRDFKIDQPRRTLVVPLDRDSDILNYRVKAKRPGIGNLTVEFYQEGTLIGRAVLKIVVKKKKEPVNPGT